MKEFVHGGNVESLREEYKGEILDFSANINPLGMPAAVKQAAANALEKSARYPDPYCRRLVSALAQTEQVLPEQIVCGNGAADLIFRVVLAQKPKKALLTAPAFAEYEAALRLADCKTEYEFLLPEHDFALTESFLQRLTADVDMVFLCNPNNPTGKALEPSLLQRVMERCEQNHILLVLDCCFEDFLDEKSEKGLPNFQNLFVLKAFTKFYAMAGLRLGYGLSHNIGLLERIRAVGPPWNVSTPAQAAGVAALKQTEYAQKTKEYIRTERDFLKQGLQSLGLKIYGSQANFIFFLAPTEHLEQQLRKRGVLIRSCANYKGLSPFYYRVAVRTREENKKLLDLLGKL